MQRFIDIGKTDYTAELAKYIVASKFEDLPAEVIDRAKHITLHTIGAGLAASKLSLIQKAERVAARISGGGSGSSTIWGNGKKSSSAVAAFANGTAADALDWEDCSWTGHPSAGLIPAGIAVAEETQCSGKDYLVAIVAAYEVYQRIAMSVQPPDDFNHSKGWGLATWQIFTASVAAAKLYNLNEKKTEQAMGMSVLYHKMLSNLQQATMSDAYHYEWGFSALSGILAAICAQEGVDNLERCMDIPYAYQEQLTESVKREWLLKDIGQRYLIMDLLIKHWPANMWVQTPVEICVDLVKTNGINLEDIESIIVDPPTQGRMHFDSKGFSSTMDAQFSLPYTISAALYYKHPGAEWYSEEAMKNEQILQLAAKVHGGENPPLSLQDSFLLFQSGGFPVKQVTIVLKDGKTFQQMQAYHKGHPNMMMTNEEFFELFMEQTKDALSERKAAQLYNFVMDLESVEDMSEIGFFFTSGRRA